MSFSFKSHGLTDEQVFGHNDTKDGNPAGGYAASPRTTKELSDMLHNPEHPTHFAVRWQDGPIDREAGEKANGALIEDVLDVCKRRLEFYQESRFACSENAQAIYNLEEALHALLERRADRAERGVLGKNEV